MGYINAQESLGTGKVTLTRFKEIWRNRLKQYKAYITDEILYKDVEISYKEYQSCKGRTRETFGFPEGLSKNNFAFRYIRSPICLNRHMKWATELSGGMGVTGTPGVAKTSIIRDTCTELGIVCAELNVAGLTNADIKGLPYIVKNANGVTTGVEYEQGTRLPISTLSAKLSGMSGDVFRAKLEMGEPVWNMPLVKDGKEPNGVFTCTGGIAPEFGVLFIDEFTNLNQNGQAAIEKIISKSVNGCRSLAEGSYILPPYWIVICAMNSSNEGGMDRGDDADDISEFIRQRLSTHGFYTVYPDELARDYLAKKPGVGNLYAEWLAWTHRMDMMGQYKYNVIPGGDKGALALTDPQNPRKTASPRLYEQAIDLANAEILKKKDAEFDKSLSDEQADALEDERGGLVGDVGSKGGNDDNDAAMDAIMTPTVTGTGVDRSEFEEDFEEDLEKRVEKARSIIAMRSMELEKIGVELTLEEHKEILWSVIGIPVIVNSFATYFMVHQSVYSHFSKIEKPLRQYLLHDPKFPQGPALGDMGEDVAKNAVAIGMSIKGYLLALSKEVCVELIDRLRKILETPEKNEKTMVELAETATAVYKIPMRVCRWLNTPKLFPVGIKDEIAAMCKDMFSFTVPLAGVKNRSHGTADVMSVYPEFITRAVAELCHPYKSELTDVAKSDKVMKNILKLLLDAINNRPYTIIKVDASTDWTGKPLGDKGNKYRNGSYIPYELDDEADYETADVIMAHGTAAGVDLSQLFR